MLINMYLFVDHVSKEGMDSIAKGKNEDLHVDIRNKSNAFLCFSTGRCILVSSKNLGQTRQKRIWR